MSKILTRIAVLKHGIDTICHCNLCVGEFVKTIKDELGAMDPETRALNLQLMQEVLDRFPKPAAKPEEENK